MSAGKQEKVNRIRRDSKESRKIIGNIMDCASEISSGNNVLENLRSIGDFSDRLEDIKDNQRSLLLDIDKELSMLALGSMWKALELNKEVLRFSGVSKHNTSCIEDGLIPSEDIREQIMASYRDKKGDHNSFVEGELCYTMNKLEKTRIKLEERRKDMTERVSNEKRPEWDSIKND